MIRRITLTTELLGNINDNVERCNKNDKTGVYDHATFSLEGKNYYVDSDGFLYRYNTKKEDWDVCGRNKVKNGIYSAYTFRFKGGICTLAAHLLAMVCLTDGFYARYMEDDNLVVNHIVSTIRHKDFMGYSYIEATPNNTVDSNPLYLELIPRGSNTRHGVFVRNNELSDVYVSANDVETLKELVSRDKSRSPLDIVVDFYSKILDTSCISACLA